MFTGIIEATGKVVSKEENGSNLRLGVSCAFTNELKVDQSVSHNGVCLTVVSIQDDCYFTDIIEETLQRSNLGSLSIGQEVNLERSLKINDRLDGHMVQGHVDCSFKLNDVSEKDGSWVYRFSIEDPEYLPLMVEKGSICVNGVSLTISKLDDQYFEVSVIPYTYEHTNFHGLSSGDNVNIEFDILGKYTLRSMEGFRKPAQ